MNTKDKIYTHITAKTQKDSIPNTKVGEILTEIVESTRTYGLALTIISKGFNADDIQNTSFDLQPGDLVRGWFDANTYWAEAMYLGVDPNVKTNYAPGVSTDYTEIRDQITYP